jgi:hypothetical protein
MAPCYVEITVLYLEQQVHSRYILENPVLLEFHSPRNYTPALKTSNEMAIKYLVSVIASHCKQMQRAPNSRSVHISIKAKADPHEGKEYEFDELRANEIKVMINKLLYNNEVYIASLEKMTFDVSWQYNNAPDWNINYHQRNLLNFIYGFCIQSRLKHQQHVTQLPETTLQPILVQTPMSTRDPFVAQQPLAQRKQYQKNDDPCNII